MSKTGNGEFFGSRLYPLIQLIAVLVLTEKVNERAEGLYQTCTHAPECSQTKSHPLAFLRSLQNLPHPLSGIPAFLLDGDLMVGQKKLHEDATLGSGKAIS